MKLVAHIIDGHHVDIRPAPVERGLGPDGAPTLRKPTARDSA